MNEQTQTLKKKILSYVWEASVYIGVFLATLILYLTIKPNAQFHRNGVLPQTLMAFGLFVLSDHRSGYPDHRVYCGAPPERLRR